MTMAVFKQSLLNFFKSESSIGIVLIMATLFALLLANSHLAVGYQEFLDIPVVIKIHEFVIAKPLLLWVNDGLMAVFFFMIGMEVKRELLEGRLQDLSKVFVPTFGAIGGMLVPALIYMLFNANNTVAMQGWAIPMATDIAFALGILSLLGKRVPIEMKLFLLTLAIIDDLGSIVVIALFFGHGIAPMALGVSSFFILLLIVMNWRGVTNNTAYVLIGILVWAAVLKSGVHATIAGVIVGLLIPLKNNKKSFYELEKSLYTPVNYVILPLFAFVNTGISFSGVDTKNLVDNVTLGIALGLFMGKQIGIFSFAALAIKLTSKKPNVMSWGQLYGVSVLGGVGFTMSLFIGSLAFECSGDACINMIDERIGILMGSFLSGVVGYFLLKKTLPNQ